MRCQLMSAVLAVLRSGISSYSGITQNPRTYRTGLTDMHVPAQRLEKEWYRAYSFNCDESVLFFFSVSPQCTSCMPICYTFSCFMMNSSGKYFKKLLLYILFCSPLIFSPIQSLAHPYYLVLPNDSYKLGKFVRV